MLIKLSEITFKLELSSVALNNIVQIERINSEYKYSKILTKDTGEINEEFLSINLHSYSKIFNLGLDNKQLKMIRLGNFNSNNPNELLIRNIRQIYDFISSNFDKGEFKIDYNLVIHLKKLLDSDILEAWEVAQIRSSSQEELIKIFEYTYFQEIKVFDYDDLHLKLRSFLEEFYENKDIPLIKSCILFLYINLLSPFSSMNFLISIILCHIYLNISGIGSNFSFSIVQVFYNLQNEFLFLKNQIESLGISEGDVEFDISYFLEKYLTAFKDQLQNDLKKFTNIDPIHFKDSLKALDFNERQIRALSFLTQHKTISRTTYSKLFKVSSMTSYRDLNELVSLGYLKIIGKGKLTQYKRI